MNLDKRNGSFDIEYWIKLEKEVKQQTLDMTDLCAIIFKMCLIYES